MKYLEAISTRNAENCTDKHSTCILNTLNVKRTFISEIKHTFDSGWEFKLLTID